MNNWLMLGGGAALVAALSSCWSYVKAILTQLTSYVIVNYDMAGGHATHIVLAYLQTHFKATRVGIKSFRVFRTFVRPRRRQELVAGEFLGTGFQVYWLGWRPIWVSRQTYSDDRTGEDCLYRPIRLTCFRGTIDIDQFMVDAVDYFNQRFLGEDVRRYRVKYVTGTDGKPVQIQSDKYAQGPARSVESDDRAVRLLKWRHDDLGPSVSTTERALDRLVLNDDARQIVSEVGHWLASEEWHHEKGIPWKRGYCLYGPPGTGKTATVRAIAEDFDLPIYVFDLATLYNDELRSAWSEMLCDTPCIALIEDIDAVFNQRQNLHGHLTFDCLLNCLDGVQTCNGLLTFITTNRLECLDEALWKRPGRIDRLVKMDHLDLSGRSLLVKRILKEWPETWPDLLNLEGSFSGAEFSDLCRRRAIERKYATP